MVNSLICNQFHYFIMISESKPLRSCNAWKSPFLKLQPLFASNNHSYKYRADIFTSKLTKFTFYFYRLEVIETIVTSVAVEISLVCSKHSFKTDSTLMW